MDETVASLIMTTVQDREQASALAGLLLEARVAACVQELAVQSHYRWKGTQHRDPEILLLVKTAADRVEAAIEAIRANHPYEVPEILAVPIGRGSDAYLLWLREETLPASA